MSKKKKQNKPKKRNPEAGVLNHTHYRKSRTIDNRKPEHKPDANEEW